MNKGETCAEDLENSFSNTLFKIRSQYSSPYGLAKYFCSEIEDVHIFSRQNAVIFLSLLCVTNRNK